MPRFILVFIASMAIYWVTARPLLSVAATYLIMDTLIEDVQRDVSIGMLFLDKLETHLTPADIQELISKNNEISNIPMEYLGNKDNLTLPDDIKVKERSLQALTPQRPLLERIIVWEVDSIHWLYLTPGNQVYHFGPTKTVYDAVRLENILRVIFYSGFLMICLFWVWQWRRRIKHLNSVAKQVSLGDLSVRAEESERWKLGPINQAINQMLRQIEALVSSQRFLTNSVAHELRTPLSRMRFIVESMQDLPNAKISAMNEELDELENLINEVLLYARADYKNAQDKPKQLNLAQIIEKEAGQHTPRCFLELDKQLYILSSEGQIQRIISNLINNVQKYAGGVIAITLKKTENNFAEIAIKDNGPGILPENIDNVFEPFFQEQKNTDGFGLGLAIVKQIVLQLGGEISVRNIENGGACFLVVLPLVEQGQRWG